MTKLPTIHELNEMSELDFDRATHRIWQLAETDCAAARLDLQIDEITAAAGGTFDLDMIPDCEFTFAHTRRWCGNAKCRDA
jgi:hypothetical protein